ncbi:MFS transporter [Streptomyces sp. NPDC050448]|uniref:MFS transporter n=1 Tax=Streptomyces sp. NPDC050448 TaxID=3155404 RepID=UPI00341AC167
MTTAQQALTSGPPSASAAEPGPPRSLFRDQAFRRLFTAAGVSKLGSSVGHLAIPLVAVSALDASPAQVGLLATFSTLAFLVIGLPAGAWVDRMRKRRVMIAADLIRAAALTSVPIAWGLGVLTVDQLYAVVLLGGMATVFFDVASQSHLPDLVGRDRLSEANAHLVMADALTLVGGRSAGGFLLSVVTAPVAVAVDAVSYLWSAACLRGVRRTEPVPKRRADANLVREIRAGLGFVFADPVLRPIAIAGACTNLAIQLCQTMLPVLVTRQLGLPDWVLGLFFAVGGVGIFLGSLSARRLAGRFGAGRVLWMMGLGVSPFGIPVALIDRGPALWLAAGAWLVAMFKVGVDNVLKVSFRQSVTPDAMLGRMNATMRFVLTGALCIGSALAGLLGQAVSVRAALWVGAVGLATVWVPIFFSPLRTAHALPK